MTNKANMTKNIDIELNGKLVFLTSHVEVWLKQINPKFKIPMANRIAKVVKVFDWGSKEGKFLLKEREKTGKWSKLKPEDFKYVLRIYYPDLIKDKKQGFTAEEVLPQYYPGTQMLLFDLVPDWMLEHLQKAEKDIFKVVEKE